MSLINDALKRASQAQRRVPADPLAEGPPMTPAPPPRPAQWPVLAVPFLLVGVLGVAVWFFYQALETSRRAVLAPSPNPVAAREPGPAAASAPTSSPEVVPAPAEPAQLEPSVAAPAIPVTDVLVAEAAPTTNPPPTAPAAPAPADPPPLKLKAIFYRPDHPTALINHKAVSIGDRVGRARVLAITMDSVSLEQDGQTNVLTIE